MRVVALFLAVALVLSLLVVSASSHAPIRINSDDELLQMAEEEGWPGDGSPGNPIVIQGYSIDADWGPVGILLGNTSLHVLVRDCEISGAEGSGYWGSGILLLQSSNITVEDCQLSSSNHGLTVYSSRNVEVSGLRVVGAWVDGISIWSSSDVQVTDLTAEENYGVGVQIRDSSTVQLEGIQISGEGYSGIEVRNSASVVVDGAVLNGPGEGKGVEAYHDLTDIVFAHIHATGFYSGAYVGGDIVIRDSSFEENRGNGVDVEGSGVTLVNVTCKRNNVGISVTMTRDVFVEDCECSDNYMFGLSVWMSSSIIVRNSVFRDNDATYASAGVDVSDSNHVIIASSQFSDNGRAAISLYDSRDVRLWSNAMHGEGILLSGEGSDLTSHEIPENNTVNGERVVYVAGSSGAVIGGGAGQVIIAGSSNVEVAGLSICEVNDGILVLESSNVNIHGNTLSGNPYNGITLAEVTGARISGNTLTGCGINIYGSVEEHFNSHQIDGSNIVNGRPVAYLVGANEAIVEGVGEAIVISSSHITVRGDFSNVNNALIVAYTDELTFTGSAGGISHTAIYAYRSDDLHISGEFSNGNLSALFFRECNRVIVEDSSIADFWYGVYFLSSNEVRISRASIEDTVSAGVLSLSSNGVEISNSTIRYCGLGVRLYNSNGVSVHDNNIVACSSWGLYSYYSEGNVSNNNFFYNNGAGDEYEEEHAQAYCSSSTVAFWENFWSDWTGPDHDGDGFVDLPYQIPEGCSDPRPRAMPIVGEFPL